MQINKIFSTKVFSFKTETERDLLLNLNYENTTKYFIT